MIFVIGEWKNGILLGKEDLQQDLQDPPRQGGPTGDLLDLWLREPGFAAAALPG
jgi:hypothetical protein